MGSSKPKKDNLFIAEFLIIFLSISSISLVVHFTGIGLDKFGFLEFLVILFVFCIIVKAIWLCRKGWLFWGMAFLACGLLSYLGVLFFASKYYVIFSMPGFIILACYNIKARKNIDEQKRF